MSKRKLQAPAEPVPPEVREALEREKRELAERIERVRAAVREMLLQEPRGKLDANGEVRIDDALCVGLSKLANLRKLQVMTLEEFVYGAGILPVACVTSGNRPCAAFPKDPVFALKYVSLPQVDSASATVRIGEVDCVAVSLFATRRQLAYQTLQSAIDAAKLPIVGEALSTGQFVDVYEKAKVEALTYVTEAESVTDTFDKATGMVTIADVPCVALTSYANYRKSSIAHMITAVTAAQLKPFGRAKIPGKRTCVDVYRQSEVDALPFTKRAIERCALPPHDKLGLVRIDEQDCLVVQIYGETHELDFMRLQEAIDAAELKPVGKAQGRTKPLPAYLRSAVEALPYVVDRRDLPVVSAQGIAMVGDVPCVAVSKYAKMNGMSSARLGTAVSEAKLPAIGRANNKGNIMEVYAQAAVEKLPYVSKRLGVPTVDSFGVTKIKGVDAIGIERYAATLGTSYAPLQNAIEGAKIAAIGQAKVKRRIVEVYPKDNVDLLPYVVDCLKVDGDIDEKGEVTIGERLCVGIARYAALKKLGHKEITQAVAEAKLEKRGRARNGGRIVDAYDKAEVDALDYLRNAANPVGKSGVVVIDGTEYVALAKYARASGSMTYDGLQGAVSRAGLQSPATARSGTLTIPVYRKEEVDALGYVALHAIASLADAQALLQREAKALGAPMEDLLDPERVRDYVRCSPVLGELLELFASGTLA